MSTRALVFTVCVTLTACGSANDDDLFSGTKSGAGGGSNPSAGAAGGGGDGARTTTGGAAPTATGGAPETGGAPLGGMGGASVGGTGGASSTGGLGGVGGGTSCVEGITEQCDCGAGPGLRTCTGGVFNDCTCGICQDGVQMPCQCADGSEGTSTCVAGGPGPCTGCPIVPLLDCPVGFSCVPSGQGSDTFICADASGSPPFCATTPDCAALAVDCTLLGPIGICFRFCTP